MQQAKKILGFIFILFLLFSLTKNLFDYQNATRFYESYKKEYDEEQKKNLYLKTHILKYKDPNELEKTIRNKLNLTKANEVAVILPNPTPPPTTPTPAPPPNYIQWFNIFFGN